MKTAWILAGTFALTAFGLGCSKKQQPDPKFSVSDVKQSSYLDFNVTFTRPLSNGRTLVIVAQSEPWLRNEVSFMDALLQSNGNSISFDCDNIADKIIDAGLVVEITPLCKWGHDKGNEYWEHLGYKPTEFTDSTGTIWRRAQ